MDKYGKLFSVTMSSLTGFLLFMLYQSLKLTDGGFSHSSRVIATLPLIVQANVSLLAFWGLVLVFRLRGLSSTRIELMKNLWEIGFKRDELKTKIVEFKEDKEKKEILMKLYEELGEDAVKQKKTIEAFYEWEAMMMYTALIPAALFVASISSGIYGISMAFHTELVDPITYFTPIVFLFIGAISTILALFSSIFRVVMKIR